MSMTDPVADLLTRIRNAHTARHRELSLPASRMKVDIVRLLKEEGYIEDFAVETDDRQGTVRLQLKYGGDGTAAITGLERISRPGRRIYRGKNGIPKVLNGLGVTIVSTPRGLMTGTSCREHGVGGEVLCNVW